MTEAPPLELWGGVECTVNRVGDRYHDQLSLSGHDARIDDLTLFADLGLAAIRYPVLWERTAPGPGAPDWRWSDARLARLRALGVRPIVGLVHHGSGPRHTDLLDPAFPTKLAAYAGQVAERYPWITDWTPVNEPLTTARFAAIYGHWYPHRRDERAFWLALLNQIDGIRLAMRAIRRVIPAARLIQTDDLGRTYATDALHAQAAHDNLRRWAGWDLGFGRVDRHHPLAPRLERLGLGERLRRTVAEPCPPDIIGLNHYLTSDRFLDHRLDRYPQALHGGNADGAYADTEAVRVLDPPVSGLATALRDAWERYATPIALTEVHNGSTRDEQLRWAAEAWDIAVAARRDGIDVRGVTAWALLGSHGWNTLLTRPGAYEPGVFDLSDGTPRPTALAALWQGLPRQAERHPVALEPGWWRRPSRLLYPPHPSDGPAEATLRMPTRALRVHGTCAHAAALTASSGARGLCLADDPARTWAAITVASPEAPHPSAHYRLAITADGATLTPLAAVPSPRAIDAALDLLIDGTPGAWHLAPTDPYHKSL